MEFEREEAMQMQVEKVERRLKDMLNPFEWQIMSFQSVLVWEKPYHSAAFLIAVNGLFWLATTVRFYYLLGVCGLLFVSMDMWSNFIWPEIRVPPGPGEDMDGWALIYPKFVSVPEICRCLAEWFVWGERYVTEASLLRRDNHTKFFVFSMFGFCLLLMVGRYMSTIFICYVIVMSALLYPCALYHDMLQRIHEQLQPLVTRWECSMNIQRKPRSKKRATRSRSASPLPTEAETDEEDDTDSDADLKEFIPTIGFPMKTPQKDDNSSDESVAPSSLVSASMTSLLLPEIAKMECSEDDSLSGDFSLSPRDMPSFDSIDKSSPRKRRSPRKVKDNVTDPLQGGDVKSMQFVPSHFQVAPSDGKGDPDESSLGRGLNFPDIHDESTADSLNSTFDLPMTSAADTFGAALATQMMTKTLSTIMSNTISGLTGVHPTGEMPSGGDAEQQQMESDILEEFEFLNDEDFEDGMATSSDEKRTGN